jgi:hypothetical protein
MGAPLHVIPLRDLKEHECSITCSCKPKVEEQGKLIVHNSWDRREEFEKYGRTGHG